MKCDDRKIAPRDGFQAAQGQQCAMRYLCDVDGPRTGTRASAICMSDWCTSAVLECVDCRESLCLVEGVMRSLQVQAEGARGASSNERCPQGVERCDLGEVPVSVQERAETEGIDGGYGVNCDIYVRVRRAHTDTDTRGTGKTQSPR